MPKFTADHPAFQRVEAFISQQIEKLAQSTFLIAAQRVVNLPQGLRRADFQQQVSEEAAKIEISLRKRMQRYYGLNGKYVGH